MARTATSKLGYYEYFPFPDIISSPEIPEDLKKSCDKLGRGVFGAVYKIRYRPVAVKEIYLRDEPCEEKTMQEVVLLARFRSKYVVSYYGYQHFYQEKIRLLMEFLPHCLLDIIEQSRRGLEHEIVLQYSKQLLEAVTYLHSQHVIHRDIKPGNILLTARKDQLKLADLGISKLLDPDRIRTELCSILSTYAYVAPEVVDTSAKYGTKADCWSSGVTMIEMLTGEPDRKNLLRRVVPVQLRKVLDSLLEKNPQNRWSAKQALEHIYPGSELLQMQKECILPVSLDGRSITWHSVTTRKTESIKIPDELIRFGAVIGQLSDIRLVMAGGCQRRREGVRGTQDPRPSDGTLVLDLSSKRFTTGPSMTTAREHAASAVLNGEMYVSGGWDHEFNVLKSVEVLRNGCWIELPDILEPRWHHALIAMKNRDLFVVGGLNQYRVSTGVEHYSRLTNSWRKIASFPVGRIGLAAAALNDCIYACGGCYENEPTMDDDTEEQKNDDFEEQKSGYCYNLTSQRWQPIADMNVALAYFSLKSFDGKLHAFDGKNSEIYDPQEDQWKLE